MADEIKKISNETKASIDNDAESSVSENIDVKKEKVAETSAKKRKTDVRTEAVGKKDTKIDAVLKKTRTEEETKSKIPDSPSVQDTKTDATKTGVRKKETKKPAFSTNKKNFKRNERPRRPRRGKPRERREFDQKIISIRRVTRVVAGGRRFSFSVAMVIGDRKGKVGVGIGKASDTALAIEKSVRNAKKNMITLKRTKTNSIRHDVSSKYCASVISILPARGRGIVAGSSVRNVLELGGITDVTAKIFSRSKNKLNNARAAINALGTLK